MLLSVRDLVVGYDNKTVVHGASLAVGERQIVALIGHNGAGKSTLLNGIFGLLRAKRGSVAWQGRDITQCSPAVRLGHGIAYARQGALVYRTLTIADNLELGGFAIKDRSAVSRNIEKVYDLFPVLRERRNGRAGLLSGGERQMLAIGALLVSSPRLALLDEPSGGLAPLLVEKVFEKLREIVSTFGTSVLLVEQNLEQAFAISDRAYVMANGRMTLDGTPADIVGSTQLAASYFGTPAGMAAQ